MNMLDENNKRSRSKKERRALRNDVYDPHDPKDPDNKKLSTQFIYFYYLTEKKDKETTAYIAHQPDPVLHSQVPDTIPKILQGIKDNAIKAKGNALGDLVWTHYSYIIVVFESSHGGKLGKKDAMTFDFAKGVGNHSFRSGADIEEVKGQKNLSAFYCFNQMKNKDGKILGEDETERFKLKVKHGHRANRAPESTRGHEDTATNLGPPRPQ